MPPPEDVRSTPDGGHNNLHTGIELHVRRMHRRDINRVWQFLKMVFRDVNRETVEFQRPRHKKRFVETYEDEGVEQLLFEINRGEKFELVGYAEYSHERAVPIASSVERSQKALGSASSGCAVVTDTTAIRS